MKVLIIKGSIKETTPSESLATLGEVWVDDAQVWVRSIRPELEKSLVKEVRERLKAGGILRPYPIYLGPEDAPHTIIDANEFIDTTHPDFLNWFRDERWFWAAYPFAGYYLRPTDFEIVDKKSPGHSGRLIGRNDRIIISIDSTSVEFKRVTGDEEVVYAESMDMPFAIGFKPDRGLAPNPKKQLIKYMRSIRVKYPLPVVVHATGIFSEMSAKARQQLVAYFWHKARMRITIIHDATGSVKKK